MYYPFLRDPMEMEIEKEKEWSLFSCINFFFEFTDTLLYSIHVYLND